KFRTASGGCCGREFALIVDSDNRKVWRSFDDPCFRNFSFSACCRALLGSFAVAFLGPEQRATRFIVRGGAITGKLASIDVEDAHPKDWLLHLRLSQHRMAGGALFDRTARPHPRLLVPQTLGAGNDLSALVTGSLTSATGSLLHVTGVTQESDPGGQNSYSLQLNTNNFNSAALCAGQAGCVGWQQFIRDNPRTVYIQYWLINHGSPCPAKPANFLDTWHFFAGAPGQSPGCFINGNQTALTVETALEDLEGMRVTGSTSPSAQSVIFEAADQIFTSTDNGDLLAIGNQWNQAEFNIFGLCCGNQAVFNIGSTIVVQIAINNGTANAPSSSSTGFTAETNNLSLVSPSCPIGGPAPAIVFTEQ